MMSQFRRHGGNKELVWEQTSTVLSLKPRGLTMISSGE